MGTGSLLHMTQLTALLQSSNNNISNNNNNNISKNISNNNNNQKQIRHKEPATTTLFCSGCSLTGLIRVMIVRKRVVYLLSSAFLLGLCLTRMEQQEHQSDPESLPLEKMSHLRSLAKGNLISGQWGLVIVFNFRRCSQMARQWHGYSIFFGSYTKRVMGSAGYVC